jgi:hypothetical protein
MIFSETGSRFPGIMRAGQRSVREGKRPGVSSGAINVRLDASAAVSEGATTPNAERNPSIVESL